MKHLSPGSSRGSGRRHAYAWAACALLSISPAHAQLPPPPVSPAPVVDLEYDAQGNFKKATVAKGRAGYGFETSHDYDRLDRRYQTTDARGKRTGFAYTGRDDLTQVTDPRRLVTSYPRNGLGDTTAMVSPDTGMAAHTWDAAGYLVTRTDSRGVIARYTYDALNRLTSVVYNQADQPAQGIVWNYDQTGNGFSYGIGRLTSTQFNSPNHAGSTRYAYDALGRVVVMTQSVTADNTVNLSVTYGYDAAGRVVSITYPSGRVLNIPHAGGLPAAMSLTPAASSAPAVPLITDVQFQPGPGAPGAVRSWVWQLDSGALPHVRMFDLYGRLVRYPLGGAVRDISYDAADRIVAYTHYNSTTGAPVADLDQGFGYDELGRLLTVSSATFASTLRYDDSGNRTLTVNGTPAGSSLRNYTVDPNSNRILGLDNPVRAMGTDAAGNLLSDNQGNRNLNFTIDPSGRIGGITATLDGIRSVGAAYGYDAGGQRVLKKLLLDRNCPPSRTRSGCTGGLLPAGTGVVYIHDQAGHLLGEYDLADGSVLREYVWLHDTPVAVIDGLPAAPSVAYIQTDHLDTPRTVIDRSGRQRWTWLAEPFGNSTPVENPVNFGRFVLNLRMPGQYFDSESGLADNWNRTYDSSVGRYTQSDPIGLRGGINTYSYVGGNPVSYADPDGLVRQGGQTGQWWEFRDRNFQRWFHLCVKQRGDPDASRGELADAYALWVSLGKPDGKNGCGGPPPPPPAPSGDTCGEDCKKVATTVVIGGTAYIVYRCLRMVPSLFPPLWPTIPANVAIP